MKAFTARVPLFVALLVLFGTSWIPTFGQNKSGGAGEALLVVADGKFSTGNVGGQPATVGKVVELLRRSYPDAAITVVGVDDVVIDQVALRLAPRLSALNGALTALAEASGRKFAVRSFSERDFVLTADRSPPGHRMAEVFNLGPLLANSPRKVSERLIRAMETDLAAVRKFRGPDSPQVAAIRTNMEIEKARLAEAAPAPDSQKLIEQIERAVKFTLELLKSPEKPPEFSFHPGSNLLIVVGGDQTLEITRKVVAAIEKAPQ